MNERIRFFRNDFSDLAEQYAEKPALVANFDLYPVTISYSQLATLIDRQLCFFEEKGLKPGDTIFVLMPNAVETLVALFATMKGGYGFAPLPCTSTKREIRQWLEQLQPKFCMTTNLINDEAKETIEENGIHTSFVDTNAKFEWLPNRTDYTNTGDAPRLFITTSGTTGEPKAIVHDSNKLWSSGHRFMEFHRLHGLDLRFWNYLPMSYLGGLFNLGIIPLCTGGCSVIDEAFSGKTFLQFWQFVERYDIDCLWLVPTIVQGLLQIAEHTHLERIVKDSDHIRYAFLGTAAIDVAVKSRFQEVFGIKLLENFALSETTFFTSEVPENTERVVQSSVGEILPYVQVKFIPVSNGETGVDTQEPTEIYVKSPYLFLGYLNASGELEKTIDDDGFFATGDLGHMADGQLIIDGRKRDIIKKGGLLIYLREVELIAEQCNVVREAAAVKVPHRFYGESYVLYIVTTSGQADQDEVNRYIHQQLVKHKWPDRIISVECLPRTASGKIRKSTLAEQTA